MKTKFFITELIKIIPIIVHVKFKCHEDGIFI